LQTDILVGDDEITGTLNYVTGYTGFSDVVSEQSGNYLALKIVTVPVDGVVTTVELVGGTKGPVTLDSDMNIVLRITNKGTQSVRVIATKGEDSITNIYGLTGLSLEAAG
jgi:hypothetical protein